MVGQRHSQDRPTVHHDQDLVNEPETGDLFDEPVYSPGRWFSQWPHDKQSVWDSWREVHARFGLAAQESNRIETGLIMMVAQMEQAIGRDPRIESLLSSLASTGRLTLGFLIKNFRRLYGLSEDHPLAMQLERARELRNYLMHHFYRDQESSFTTPEGCEALVDLLVSIRDEMDAALQYLEEWRVEQFGYRPPEELWDEINEDVERHYREEQQMLDAIAGPARPSARKAGLVVRTNSMRRQ